MHVSLNFKTWLISDILVADCANFGHASIHATAVRITPQKNRPEYPTAGAGVGEPVYSDRGKRIGPVFSSVEKAQDYLSRDL